MKEKVQCEVKVNVGGIWFSKICSTASETYEAVKGCCKGNKVAFGLINEDDMSRMTSEYLFIIANIFKGTTYSFENHIFELHRIDKDESTGNEKGGNEK